MNPEDRMRLDAVRDLVPLLGLSDAPETLRRAVALLGEEPVLQESEPSLYWIFRGAGVELAFQDGVLGTIFLHPVASGDRGAFEGVLPRGLDPSASQKAVRAALGVPTTCGGGEDILCDRDNHRLGVRPYWDRYETPGYVFLCEYAKAPERPLALVALMKHGLVPRYPILPED